MTRVVVACGRTWRATMRASRIPTATAAWTKSSLPDLEHAPSDEAGERRDEAGRRGGDQSGHARADDARDGDREDQVRHGEEQVGDRHEGRVEPSAEVAGDEAERRADRRGQGHRDDGRREGEPRPHDEPGQEVAPDLIGAQPVLRRGRREHAQEVLLVRPVRRQPGPERREGGVDEKNRLADHELPPDGGGSRDPPARAAAAPGPVRGGLRHGGAAG